MKEAFRRISARISAIAGSAWAFSLAFLIIVTWAVTGPLFGFSDTWQLVINTGTTIVTFLMVFLIQNTQNRDSKAMQLKLDELIRATRARDSFIDIEDLSDDELTILAEKFQRIQKQDEPNPAFHKFNKKFEAVMNSRLNLPGEKAATEMANRFNPFTDHNNHKK
ncbi:MAG: low affinity iron permease family protein [bacterium]|nr:low affinity iron permease family protein [bacterium]